MQSKMRVRVTGGYCSLLSLREQAHTRARTHRRARIRRHAPSHIHTHRARAREQSEPRRRGHGHSKNTQSQRAGPAPRISRPQHTREVNGHTPGRAAMHACTYKRSGSHTHPPTRSLAHARRAGHTVARRSGQDQRGSPLRSRSLQSASVRTKVRPHPNARARMSARITCVRLCAPAMCCCCCCCSPPPPPLPPNLTHLESRQKPVLLWAAWLHWWHRYAVCHTSIHHLLSRESHQ
jgi:hypothetical protein